MKTYLQIIFVSVGALLMGACTTAANIRTFDDYLQMDESARLAVKQEIDKKVAAKKSYDKDQTKLLNAQMPVYFVVDNIKMTKLWDKQTRTLTIYDGYVTGSYGQDSLVLLKYVTEEESPNLVMSMNTSTGKYGPTIIAANVSVQETMQRTVTKALIGVAGNTLNGAVAARISKCDDCGSMTLINQGGNTSAESGSYAEAKAKTSAKANAGVGGCLSANCTSVPRE